MSIIFHQITRDTGGALPLNVDTGPIVGGVPSQGLILNSEGKIESVLDGTVDRYYYGLPFDADDRLCVTLDPLSFYDQAIPFAANGMLSIGGDGQSDFIAQGACYKDAGGLISVDPISIDLPGQVQNLVISIPVDNQIHSVWDANVAGDNVTSYTIGLRKTIVGGPFSTQNVGLSLTHDFLSLESGVSYDVQVFATNAGGDGPVSTTQTIVVEGIPEQSDLTALAGIEQANLSWTEPTPAPALTGILLELKLNADSQFSTFGPISLGTTAADIYNLVDSLYDFRVTYTNSKGSSASDVQQATPTLIGPANYLELNELGFSSSPVAVTNTGTDGSSRDFTTQSGSGPALTAITHKGRNAWFSADDRSLKATSAQSTKNHPQCIYWCGSPNNLSSNFRRLWASDPAQSNATLRDSESRMDAGGSGLGGVATDTSGAEFIIFYRFNGGSSSIRVIKNGGSDTTSGGSTNAGSNIAPSHIFWDSQETFAEDVTGDCYEFGALDGDASAAEEEAKIKALEQKWFVGVPDITPPQALMVWDETGIQGIGPGNPATGWINTGAGAGSDDYDTPEGTVANLKIATRNGMNIAFFDTDCNFRCSNPSAGLTAPYTIYMAGQMFFYNGSPRFWFSAPSDNVTFSPNDANHTLFAGSSFVDSANGTTSATVYALVVDGSSSRIYAEGGSTINTLGTAGTNTWITDILGWNQAKTAFQEFDGHLFEARVYSGADDLSTIQAKVTSIRNKWNI